MSIDVYRLREGNQVGSHWFLRPGASKHLRRSIHMAGLNLRWPSGLAHLSSRIYSMWMSQRSIYVIVSAVWDFMRHDIIWHISISIAEYTSCRLHLYKYIYKSIMLLQVAKHHTSDWATGSDWCDWSAEFARRIQLFWSVQGHFHHTSHWVYTA
jgi:hypothetical protein